MTTTAAAAGGRGSMPGRTFFHSSSLLLLLGFALLSFYGTAGDKELASSVRPHGYIRQGSTNGLAADDNLSTLGDKRDAGELDPLARMPGGDSAGSLLIAAQSNLEQLDLTRGEVDGCSVLIN